MAVAFSSNDETAITQSIDNFTDTKIENVEACFEIERCVNWIKSNQHKTVALQFPDSLMKYSPQVASYIESKLEQKIYVLGDTSYGECCVDEVAAEHIGADSVIHFGRSCLTPTQRLPVLNIFTVLPFNIESFESSILKKFGTNVKVAVVYDVQFHEALTKTEVKFAENIFICPPHPPKGTGNCGRKWPEEGINENWTIVYVGQNENFQTLLSFTFSKSQLVCYDPCQEIFIENTINLKRALMKRYMLIEKTKDADRIGILVGTLGASRYGDIIDQVRHNVKTAGKRVYTFLVGKPNVPKLANFPEIDVFVLVACPENSLLDSKEYLRPIITPFELDVALNNDREWTGHYYANFSDILPDGKEYCEFEKCPNGADMSLVSGKIRVNEDTAEDRDIIGETALATQETRITTLHKSGGGEYLSQRTWQGLEQKLGETPASVIVEGQKGIAWGYENEPQ